MCECDAILAAVDEEAEDDEVVGMLAMVYWFSLEGVHKLFKFLRTLEGLPIGIKTHTPGQ